MEKMSLAVFGETGHVLGALTGKGELSNVASDLVGESLQIREPVTGEILLSVEASRLKVELVDRQDQALLAARKYALVDGVPEEQGNISSLTLTGSQIQLTLPDDTTQDLEAWVQVEGGGTSVRIVRKIEIPRGHPKATPVTEALSLDSGDFGVLAMVPGYHAWTGRVTVP